MLDMYESVADRSVCKKSDGPRRILERRSNTSSASLFSLYRRHLHYGWFLRYLQFWPTLALVPPW